MDYLKYQRKLNILLAVPFYANPTYKGFWNTIYQFVSETIVIAITLAQILAIPHVYENMNILCGCLSSGSHSFQVVVKTFYLRMHRKQFETHFHKTTSILKKIDEFEIFASQKTSLAFSIYLTKQSKYITMIAITQLLVNFASTSAYFLPFVYNSIFYSDTIEKQILPIVIYIGVDYKLIPYFQIVTIILTIGFFMVNLKSIVIDNFILNVIILHMSQLKHHNNLLKEICQNSKRNDDGNKIDSQSIKLWIVQHQILLRLFDDFNKIVSPYLCIEFSYIFFHTCIPAFVITATFSWTTPQKVAVFFMVGNGIIILFFMSLAGDSFYQEWQETGNILFHENKVAQDDKFINCVYLMIQRRLQRTFCFSAFGVLPLSCTTFLGLVKLIFSYYVTLSQIQKIKHSDII